MTLPRPSLSTVLATCLLTLVSAGTSAAVNLVPWQALASALSKHESATAEPIPVVPLEPAVAAESSFTYAATLARLMDHYCSIIDTPALNAASEAEKQADPAMAALAVAAAERRAETMTRKSCRYIDGEIEAAEQRAQGGKPEAVSPAHPGEAFPVQTLVTDAH